MEKSPKPLTDAHLRAIGRVVTTWAILDHTLQMLCCHLLSRGDTDERALFLIPFCGMQTRVLVGLAQSLIAYRHPPDEQRFKKLGEQILKAKAQRDVFSHCMWEPGSKPGAIAPFDHKTVGGLKSARGQQFTADDIEAHADNHFALFKEIAIWGARYAGEMPPPPWPDKRPQPAQP